MYACIWARRLFVAAILTQAPQAEGTVPGYGTALTAAHGQDCLIWLVLSHDLWAEDTTFTNAVTGVAAQGSRRTTLTQSLV